MWRELVRVLNRVVVVSPQMLPARQRLGGSATSGATEGFVLIVENTRHARRHGRVFPLVRGGVAGDLFRCGHNVRRLGMGRGGWGRAAFSGRVSEFGRPGTFLTSPKRASWSTLTA